MANEKSPREIPEGLDLSQIPTRREYLLVGVISRQSVSGSLWRTPSPSFCSTAIVRNPFRKVKPFAADSQLAKILTVCRRVLGYHDAEDALQATFLLLARKATKVVKHEVLGSFLYKLAYRTAVEAKTLDEKRKKRENLMASLPPIAAPGEEVHDWYPVLYRELNRLPKKYRQPIILCDLEGQTRRQVASQLKISEGTLSSLLSRGRVMLAQRLARRGLGLSVGALTTALGQETASAQMIPASLVIATTDTVKLMAGIKLTTVSIPAVILMKGVLKAMFLTKLKIAAGILLVAGVLGASGFAYRSKYVQAAPPNRGPSLLGGGTGLIVSRKSPPPEIAKFDQVNSSERSISHDKQPKKTTPQRTGDKPLRVLLFASAPMRDYQLLRTFLVREADKKRVELTIHLQPFPGRLAPRIGVVQDVPPERILQRFPTATGRDGRKG